MNPIEKFFKDILDGIMEPAKTTETDMGVNKKKIQVELPDPPPPGGFASGDKEYDDALIAWRKLCNAKILEAIPRSYTLKSSEIKEEKIVRYYADLVVEKS